MWEGFNTLPFMDEGAGLAPGEGWGPAVPVISWFTIKATKTWQIRCTFNRTIWASSSRALPLPPGIRWKTPVSSQEVSN